MSEETIIDSLEGDKNLPSMLNVLTILTFIGSGLGILLGLLLLVGAGALAAKIPGLGAALGGGFGAIAVMLISCAAAIFGALQMRKLQKTGFFIYVGAVVIGILGPILMSGVSFSVGSLLFPAIFVGLYAMNLKHMS